MAALGDAGKNGDGTKYRDGPEQPLPVAHFLQVKAGYVGTKEVRPRQKEADAQADGSQIDQLRSAQGDRLIFRRGIGGGGFRFRFDGDFVGHNDFLLIVIVNHGESSL